VRFFLPEEAKAVRLKLLVWGESASFAPVICTKGQGAGSAAGGEWNPIGAFTHHARREACSGAGPSVLLPGSGYSAPTPYLRKSSAG